MADRGSALSRVTSTAYAGIQLTTRVPSFDGDSSNSRYLASVGKTFTAGISQATSNAAEPPSRNSVSNGITNVRQTNLAGLQTNLRTPTFGGSPSNSNFISGLSDYPSTFGIITTPSSSLVGDDFASYTNESSFYVTHLSTSLGTGVKYYTMWGLDNTSTPRSWVVKNEPDTTGGQSGYNMSTGSIRIVNTWVT